MRLRNSFYIFARHGFTDAAILLVLLFLTACSGNEDIKVIDFSKTVQVSKLNRANLNRPSLRVAVGATISPKETFIYYRQILDRGLIERNPEWTQTTW